ncbi:hypothetical protein EVAR_61304_1 [Eumeta japonica]|uniref:Uncharacterized protein n=1 Tax=Eumeta variegata TaxID=151549 RepID=A0A4C1XM25_EUMVA|nr:hypothetical protein EVAR_61304_1 [Eumeta japonica]
MRISIPKPLSFRAAKKKKKKKMISHEVTERDQPVSDVLTNAQFRTGLSARTLREMARLMHAHLHGNATTSSETSAGTGTVAGPSREKPPPTAKFRHGLLQLMIHTIDPMHDEKKNHAHTNLTNEPQTRYAASTAHEIDAYTQRATNGKYTAGACNSSTLINPYGETEVEKKSAICHHKSVLWRDNLRKRQKNANIGHKRHTRGSTRAGEGLRAAGGGGGSGANGTQPWPAANAPRY